MALNSVRDTSERQLRIRVLTAAAPIFAGALVAINADGKAVPASDTAGLRVLGRAEHTVAAAENLRIASGVFRYENGASGAALAAADTGTAAVVVDDETVGKTSTNKIAAGIVAEVASDGIWVDTTPGAVSAAAAMLAATAAATAAAAAAAAADDAADDAADVAGDLATHAGLTATAGHAAE